MEDPWTTLCAAGVPEGAVRPVDGAIPAGDAIVAALERVLPSIDVRSAEPIAAWLSAFSHHWPARFDRALGASGRGALQRLRRLPLDRGRYLKLRRIAIENLAARLR